MVEEGLGLVVALGRGKHLFRWKKRYTVRSVSARQAPAWETRRLQQPRAGCGLAERCNLPQRHVQGPARHCLGCKKHHPPVLASPSAAAGAARRQSSCTAGRRHRAGHLSAPSWWSTQHGRRRQAQQAKRGGHWPAMTAGASDARKALACRDRRRQHTRAARAQAGAGHPGKQARQQAKQASGIKTAPPICGARTCQRRGRVGSP